MAKELLNEAERFLLQNWREARLLEESMEAVRIKYTEAYQRIVEGVMKKHPELDVAKVYAREFWGDGSVGVGRKKWPVWDEDVPTGFWIENIRLETLWDNSAEEPCATIWMDRKTARKANLNLQQARAAIALAAKKILDEEQISRCEKLKENDEYLLSFPTLGKKDLLEMFGEGDGERFVGYFISLFDSLARFTPVLDKVFGTKI